MWEGAGTRGVVVVVVKWGNTYFNTNNQTWWVRGCGEPSALIFSLLPNEPPSLLPQRSQKIHAACYRSFPITCSPGKKIKGLTPKGQRTSLHSQQDPHSVHNHMKNMAGWCIDRCKREIPDLALFRSQQN